MSDIFNAISDLKSFEGQPVALLADGRVTLAEDATRPAIGLLTGFVAAGHSQGIQTSGEITLSDWTYSTGLALLVLGATYYLSTSPGRLTTTPTGQRVGEAITRTKLLVRISDVAGTGAHTHPISDVVNLQTTLDGKAALAHTHAQADVTNLVSDLAGKAASVHTHAQADVTGLVTALAGKVPTSRIVGGQDSINIASGTDLSADVFLNLQGDEDLPGNNKVYGTNSSGVKGWKNDPGGAPPDTSYSPGSFTVATETAKILSRHLKLTTTQRATLAGTATLRIT